MTVLDNTVNYASCCSAKLVNITESFHTLRCVTVILGAWHFKIKYIGNVSSIFDMARVNLVNSWLFANVYPAKVSLHMVVAIDIPLYYLFYSLASFKGFMIYKNYSVLIRYIRHVEMQLNGHKKYWLVLGIHSLTKLIPV